MKATIFTECDRDTGLGHLVRCIALSQTLAKKVHTKIFVKGNSKLLPNMWSNKVFDFDWINNYDSIIKQEKETDIILIDSYLAGKKIYEKITNFAQFAVFIDDYKRLNYPKGLVINGTTGAEKINYPSSSGNKYLLGSKYIILREEFWGHQVRKISDEVKSILILTGSSDLKGSTPKILKSLEAFFPNARKRVVLNEAFSKKKIKSRSVEIVDNPKVNLLRNIMYSSDIAISAAGQTLNELAATGTPTIAIGVAKNQSLNLKGYYSEKFIDNIIWWNDKNFVEKLYDSLKQIKDKEARKSKSAIGKKLVDGKGSTRIVNYILSHIS